MGLARFGVSLDEDLLEPFDALCARKGYANRSEAIRDLIRRALVEEGWQKPQGFCDSAWDSVSPFVMTLAHGGGDFYDGWMKNRKSAMISCNDGFRPVSFLIEALDEDT